MFLMSFNNETSASSRHTAADPFTVTAPTAQNRVAPQHRLTWAAAVEVLRCLV